MAGFLDLIMGQQAQQPVNYQAQVPVVPATAPITPQEEVGGLGGIIEGVKGWMAKPENREKLQAFGAALSGSQEGRSNSMQLGNALNVMYQTGEARKAQTKKEARQDTLDLQADEQAGANLDATKTNTSATQVGITQKTDEKGEKKRALELRKMEAEIAKWEAEAWDAPNAAAKSAADVRLKRAQAKAAELKNDPKQARLNWMERFSDNLKVATGAVDAFGEPVMRPMTVQEINDAYEFLANGKEKPAVDPKDPLGLKNLLPPRKASDATPK